MIPTAKAKCIAGKKTGCYNFVASSFCISNIQVIVGAAYILHMVYSFFSAFFVFLAKVREGIKNPEPFEIKGFRVVWVRRFELPAS